MFKKLICRIFGHKRPRLHLFQLIFSEYNCLRCGYQFKPSNEALIPEILAKTIMDCALHPPSIFMRLRSFDG